MLSETLTAGLERYKIGLKIRALRLRKEMGLVQLGRHTGLSTAMLSKIERGQLFPTLPTLLRIALVFGVGLDYFFVERKDRPSAAVIRKKDRIRFSDTPGRENPSYYFESLDFPVTNRKMEAFYAEFPAHAKPTEPHQHKGAELIFVMRGQLAVATDGDEVVLEEGDAMHLDSGTPHSYRREGRSVCTAIVVVAPQ